MTLAPKPPPISTPLVDKDGKLTLAWYKYLTGGVDYTRNVNSGAAQAQADASAALAAADAASQTAQATSGNAFSISVDSPYAIVSSASFGSLTTNSVVVTPTGGTPPYTYAWAKVSGDTVTIDAATSATTSFSGEPTIGGALSGTYHCVVTDNVAATASIVVGVTISNIYIPW